MGLLNFRYGYLLSAVIPAQAGIQSSRHRNLSGKRFPKFYVLDSRLRGNDGRYIGSSSETRYIRFQTAFLSSNKAFPL